MQKAVLFGPFVGEMFWEYGRFASHFIWKRKVQYKDKPDIKFIVFTRPDRFDMYGKYANILVPLKISGDFEKYKGDCYRLINFPFQKYQDLCYIFQEKYKEKYKIVEHVYPNLKGKNFAKKNQYPLNQMVFNDFRPRKDNKLIVDKTIPDDKPLVVLAPRYRGDFRRNWPYWDKLYKLISKNNIMNNYNFVICGKAPEYIPDDHNRFFDINHFETTENTSLIGFTIECMKRAHLTIGSQSAIPNISLLHRVPVLEWGHQKTLHTKTYNIFNTKVKFLEDPKYKIDPEEVFDNILKILKQKEGE